MVTSRSLLKGTRIKTQGGETRQILGLIVPSDPSAVVASSESKKSAIGGGAATATAPSEDATAHAPVAAAAAAATARGPKGAVVFEDPAEGSAVEPSELAGSYHWAKEFTYHDSTATANNSNDATAQGQGRGRDDFLLRLDGSSASYCIFNKRIELKRRVEARGLNGEQMDVTFRPGEYQLCVPWGGCLGVLGGAWEGEGGCWAGRALHAGLGGPCMLGREGLACFFYRLHCMWTTDKCRG